MTTSKAYRISKQRFLTMASVRDHEWGFRLTLIRHAETNENRNKIIQGQENTVLNETGKEQVELLGNRFKYEHITRIYSSDLDRAVKTAEGICLRNVHLKDIKICMDLSLRERNYGEAEGKSRPELKKMLCSGKLPRGAETETQLQKRVVDFFTSLLQEVIQLKKSLRAKVEKIDSSLQRQHSDKPSKVDLTGDVHVRTPSHSDPSSDKSIHLKDALNKNLSSAVKEHRATSLPQANNREMLQPVLLKDLCHDINPSDCDHTDRPVHVVVVSHGGVLRHFVWYFAKNFHVQFPRDKRKLSRQACPNTGVSEFMVHMEGRKVMNIDCSQLYDKSHLRYLS